MTSGTTRHGRLAPVAGLAVVVALLAGCGSTDHGGHPPAAAAPSPSVPSPPVAAMSPTSAPGPVTGPVLVSSPPTRVSIPKLDVTSALVSLGRQADGTMAVPANADVVGWFTGAPTPGALGPAVLAGHVDWHGTKGAFADLSTLTAGDLVSVAREDGSTAEFTVTRVARYPKDRFPTDAVYGPIANAGLRLITCGGEFDRATGHYLDNVIAFAELTRAVR